MKIGFDISQTGRKKAGCGYFAESLITHLSLIDKQNQYILYPTLGDHYWDSQFNTTCCFKLKNFQQGLTCTSLDKAKAFWQNQISDIEKQLGSVDILHTNNFFCPPKLKHTKLVYTLYDLSFLEYPACSTEHNRIACFDGVFKASLNADLIIAISHYTRQHFLRTFPHYPAERIVVTYPANRFDKAYSAPIKSKKLAHLQSQQFWLTVGTIEPRKNVKRLLQAYAKLKAQQPTLPLVLAGKPGWMENDIEKTINDLNLTADIHLLGYVDNNELAWLYQNCFCLVYPSLFEGFGLPVLEAMSFGKPVISSNNSSIPEIIGSAGILINPLDVNELSQAMLQVWMEPACRTQLITLATQQAKLFSWEATAKKILTLYEEVLALPKKNSLFNNKMPGTPLGIKTL